MVKALKLMCVFAHPDDETLGVGGILAKYAAQGVETYLLTATRGERGWYGKKEDYPGEREGELCAAAEALGLKEVRFLDYIDGDLDQADSDEVVKKIVHHLRRVRPQVVVTFDPFGAYGHPDHIAICQFTSAALVAAADPKYPLQAEQAPHRVSKLYYMVGTREEMDAYQSAFGELVMHVDGIKRCPVPWKPWAITTWVDASAYREQVWKAVSCHHSQLRGYQALMELPEEQTRQLWDCQSFYRAYSLVNGGREQESDLFAGLRSDQHPDR
jgi:LmbE family N-acetylglucosaminyl deacetylase